MLDAERVRRICRVPVAGTADHFGEQVLGSSLLRTAAASARQVRSLADDESLAPGQLISHALHALTPLDGVRHDHARARHLCPSPPKEFPMTDPAERIETERAQLLSMAERSERLRAGITVPPSPADQPDLAGASKQLASLSGLVRDLSTKSSSAPSRLGPEPTSTRS